jgi:hypothetical protein
VFQVLPPDANADLAADHVIASNTDAIDLVAAESPASGQVALAGIPVQGGSIVSLKTTETNLGVVQFIIEGDRLPLSAALETGVAE